MNVTLRAPVILAAVLLSSCSPHTNFALPSENSAQTAAARGVQRYSETVLYNFSSPGYGPNYVSPLTPDGRGDYFGTTEAGGAGHGTVYELTPNGKGGWNASTLYAFTGFSDGGTPAFTPVILDKNGNVYGVTDDGGVNNVGVAYELQHSGQTWSEHVLYDFGSPQTPGVHPFSFIADSMGNFFGTVNLTMQGGWTEGVFELSPSSKGWQASLIFVDDIPSATSGGGGLAIDAKRNIFGVSSLALQPSEIFKLSPSANGGWRSSVLYTFPRINLDPQAPPVLDKMGNIYGATVAGGPADRGTIYELTPSGNSWTYHTLYAFKSGLSDGAAPYASVTFDAGGNIYGTTQGGGAYRKGTVYKLTWSGGRYVSKLLWSFDGADGSAPFDQVVLDAAGDVFGTTTQGGSSRGHACAGNGGCGDAFEIK